MKRLNTLKRKMHSLCCVVAGGIYIVTTSFKERVSNQQPASRTSPARFYCAVRGYIVLYVYNTQIQK
jgi:hypothetical protein